jgi:hypothetical protein
MNETRARSWAHLHELLFADSWHEALARHRSDYVFRGEASRDARLTTSLQRLGGDYARVEPHLLRSFRKYARRDDVPEDSVWHWLALAKHHGLATRLLDWTYSRVLEVAAELPDADAARQLVAAVDDVTRGKRWDVVDAQMARLRARIPEHDPIAALEDAERRFRDLEMPFHVAVAQAERAERLVAAGQAVEAARLLAQARDTFERLRALPWLDRVDAALGREQVVA